MKAMIPDYCTGNAISEQKSLKAEPTVTVKPESRRKSNGKKTNKKSKQ